jgi:putative ABC transport system permease protein
MVALGLIGVLWQNVSQRIGEIGLRRALGGTPAHLARQIQGEQFVITSIGVTAASGLVLQIPLLNLTDGAVNTEVFLVSLVVSLVVMFGLTYFCSMFPGWLAMQIEPAEALHYE